MTPRMQKKQLLNRITELGVVVGINNRDLAFLLGVDGSYVSILRARKLSPASESIHRKFDIVYSVLIRYQGTKKLPFLIQRGSESYRDFLQRKKETLEKLKKRCDSKENRW